MAELFDNSIDGGARTIAGKVSNVTKRGRGSFVIIDDGCGVGRLASLMTQGESSRPANGEEHIGRFGVGAKDCIYRVGGLPSTLYVQSSTGGGRGWRASIDWDTQDSWVLEQEECLSDDLDLETPTGLMLAMTNCHRRMAGATELRQHLSRVHWPWLGKEGNLMTINGVRVEEPVMPMTDNQFDDSLRIEVDDNRWFSVSGGLLLEDSDLNGVNVIHGNRSLYVADGIGLEGAPRAGLCVMVKLHGKWSLERNKKGLSQNDDEVLCSSLEQVLEPLIRQVQAKDMELPTGNLLDDINDMLAGIQVDVGIAARPNKRGTKRKSAGATVDRKVSVATVVKPGPDDVKSRRKAMANKPYRIQYSTGDKSSIGSVDERNKIILLYQNNKSVALMRDNNDRQSILMAGAFLLAHQVGSAKLPFANLIGELAYLIMSGKSSEVPSA